MVGCCGGSSKVGDEEEAGKEKGKKEDPEKNRKFEKGGPRDISKGPVKDGRSCTDTCCLIFWLAHLGLFAVVTVMGMADGNPYKLIRPRDFMGNYCGVQKQWNNDFDMTNYAFRGYMMNVEAAVSEIAKQLICSTTAEDVLENVWGEGTDMEDYRCACCKSACRSCLNGALQMEDLDNPAALESSISGRMGDLTNPGSATSLFSPDGANGDMFADMWGEATKYFVATCQKDCDSAIANSTRTYKYSPPPDVSWKKAWDTLASHASTPQAIKDTIAERFMFGALPLSECPYETRYCVPFPGIEFLEQPMKYCMFVVKSEVAAIVGDAAGSAMQAAADAAEGAKKGLLDAAGDVLVTFDVFAVVCVFAFCCGMVFLIILRIVVGYVVWGSLALVLAMLVAAGFGMYVRSGQCAGSGFMETGQAAGSAALVAAQSKAMEALSSENNTRSEAMTGYGGDYRGAQGRSRSGRRCQRWDSQIPHNHTTTPENFPDAGLEENFCRNPEESAITIWCYTSDTDKRWELCSPIGVTLPKCPRGYEVDSEMMRDALEIFAYVTWAFAGIFALAVFCLRDRIRLAVGVNKVAAMYIFQQPAILAVPIVQLTVSLLWCLFWCFCATFLLSQVPDGYTPTGFYATYEEAYGTADTPGACTDKWPTGAVWHYEGDLNATDDLCSGNRGDTSELVGGPKCWRCMPPRYVFDTRFAFSFFSYLWNNAFIIAIGQCVIAGAVGVWFFTPTDEKKWVASVRGSIKIVFKYHLGSLAFGAFILAVVQFIRYCMKYLEKQAQAQKNKVMVLVLKVVQCLLWCFEKCIAFLNKNAYIQIALLGTNFCTSAKAAFFLIMRNALRFGTVCTLSSIIHSIGFAFIIISVSVVGYLVLITVHPSVSPVAPMLVYVSVGYMAGKLYMNVFGLAVDTALQCFIIVEEMGDAADLEVVPKPLKRLLPQGGQEEGGGLFGSLRKVTGF
eukprot:TRINITY_DN90621_c0_g1_i1.p1 TRINITY_DN90621_c0_g1~~TRINITY_DN90621_c0_g1_i1.p1  ORF type:complete len:959 (+),score=236.38 TRINITY_DN90621_c0_g1_i1:167-3043(+)